MKEVGFELGVKEWRSYTDDESCEFMERAELVCVGRSESKMERPARDCREEACLKPLSLGGRGVPGVLHTGLLKSFDLI